MLGYALDARIKFSFPLFPVNVTTAGLRDGHPRFGLGLNTDYILKNALPTAINEIESRVGLVGVWSGALHMPPLFLGIIALAAPDKRPILLLLETRLRSQDRSMLLLRKPYSSKFSCAF